MRWITKRGWMYAAMLAISAFALFPVYYVLITSLKTREEIYSRTPDLWPNHPNWGEYTRVLGEGHVGRALVNSAIVAGGTMVVCLLVSAFAAYALARWRFKLTSVLMMLVLMAQMFPLVVLVIPLFVMMRKADLLGTYWSLIITYLAFAVPLLNTGRARRELDWAPRVRADAVLAEVIEGMAARAGTPSPILRARSAAAELVAAAVGRPVDRRSQP